MKSELVLSSIFSMLSVLWIVSTLVLMPGFRITKQLSNRDLIKDLYSVLLIEIELLHLKPFILITNKILSCVMFNYLISYSIISHLYKIGALSHLLSDDLQQNY
ncbi:hypothetical protein BpHYR1_049476 [Brachionus plicatilis]|uniref:Uncharacterized protein n=1 Tax=Brachionus plicatilis TaxID=10195 RepID=A0A3M7RDS9_BRAPC|nr:hypothetical protein BpHYR1_049476 [Brachionus plicatilis]